MENNSVTKHFFVSLGLIALVLGTFWGGYAYGAKKTYYQYSVPNLKHTEATNISPTAVDFAPFWKAWNILGEKFVSTSTSTGALDDQSKVWGAIAGLTASLGDPYTVFFPPVESKSFSEEISGNFGGIGAELSAKDGVLTVVSPLKGSPAERAGIRSEDAVLAIDSKTTSGLSIDEAINQIRGEIGTSVVLTVLHKDTTSPVDIKIIRDNNRKNKRKNKSKKIKKNIFFLRRRNFFAPIDIIPIRFFFSPPIPMFKRHD